MLSNIYGGVAALFIGLYAFSALTGWEWLTTAERHTVPPEHRTGRGWSRTSTWHSIWISGYHGGK